MQIRSSCGDTLEFLEREPDERAIPIERFTVRLRLNDLVAKADVFGGYIAGHPTALFQDMARRWMGWSGELSWESVEGELALTATHDGHGHVTLRVALRPSASSEYWRVVASFDLEPGTLEQSAAQARAFFGNPEPRG